MRKILILLAILLALPLALAGPVYQDIAVSPASSTEFSPGRQYAFVVNWTESQDLTRGIVPGNITNATFEANFNGTTINYTGTAATNYVVGVHNNSIGQYWINFSMGVNVTGGGTFSYKWYACNTTNTVASNATSSQSYVIAKNTTAPVHMNLTVYDSAGTVSIVNDSSTTSYEGKGTVSVGCWMGWKYGETNYATWGTTSKYKDGVSWTSGTPGQGVYTIKCNSTGNVNYTSNSTGKSLTLTVEGGGGGGPTGSAIPDGTTVPSGPLVSMPPGIGISRASERAKSVVSQIFDGFVNFIRGIANGLKAILRI
jgi:hypothetical protein